MRVADDRGRDLTADEIKRVPEVAQLPEGAQVLYVQSWGTYDGTRFDGIDPNALYDCFFDCPGSFSDAASWFEHRLVSMGWPNGVVADGAKVEWHKWARGMEHVDLIDFTESTWTQFARPQAGWSQVRLNYYRHPARDFTSDDEYQAWFKEGPGKGERWRNRSRSS